MQLSRVVYIIVVYLASEPYLPPFISLLFHRETGFSNGSDCLNKRLID